MNGRASKRKGNTFERECVNQAKIEGFEAKRAYASNGLSLGYTEEVDVLIDGIPIQCKRRKKIARWLKPPVGAEAVLVREDHGETYLIQPYKAWLASRGDTISDSK